MLNFNESYVTVKAMVFQRGREYASVLCTVPEEILGTTMLVGNKARGAGPRPDSCGTYIQVKGRGLMTPAHPIPLTRYEEYMEKEGWSFKCTLRHCHGKSVKDSFKILHQAIRVLRQLDK